MAVDKVKGNVETPISQNNYIYCKNNSVCRVDLDGRKDYIYTSKEEYTVEIRYKKVFSVSLKKKIDFTLKSMDEDMRH